jgi:hypothetical protein
MICSSKCKFCDVSKVAERLGKGRVLYFIGEEVPIGVWPEVLKKWWGV